MDFLDLFDIGHLESISFYLNCHQKYKYCKCDRIRKWFDLLHGGKSRNFKCALTSLFAQKQTPPQIEMLSLQMAIFFVKLELVKRVQPPLNIELFDKFDNNVSSWLVVGWGCFVGTCHQLNSSWGFIIPKLHCRQIYLIFVCNSTSQWLGNFHQSWLLWFGSVTASHF